MRRIRRRRGMSLVEVMVAVFLFGATVMGASALFPLSAVMRDRSGGYSRAAAIVQRKLEQIRRLPAERLTYTNLRSAGIVDASASAPYPFTTTDALAGEFTDASGEITLTDTGTNLVRVDVAITWRGFNGRQNQISGTTFVSSKQPYVETSL